MIDIDDLLAKAQAATLTKWVGRGVTIEEASDQIERGEE